MRTAGRTLCRRSSSRATRSRTSPDGIAEVARRCRLGAEVSGPVFIGVYPTGSSGISDGARFGGSDDNEEELASDIRRPGTPPSGWSR
jgi:hypothetical protein